MNIFDIFRKKQPEKTATQTGNNSQPHIGQPVSNPQPQTEKPKAQPQAEEPQSAPTQVPADGKAHIYNLIIIDESGSMGHLRNATLSGVNETLNAIRQAKKDYTDTQTHFLTLVTFDAPGPRGMAVRTLIDTKPIGDVTEFTDYHPNGGTPLYDAMGQSINHLHQLIKEDSDASAIVTVMTDGLENASREYNAHQLKTLIEQLKEEGWTFNYMGSAHDVHSVCDLLSIENVIEFSHDEAGTDETWRRERMSKKRMFAQMSLDWDGLKSCSDEEKREYRKRNSKGFYDHI